MSVVQSIRNEAAKAILELYQVPIPAGDILVNQTKPEFTGDYTLVLFALVKPLKKSPESLGNELGRHLAAHGQLVASYNVIKGFLNLVVSVTFLHAYLQETYEADPLVNCGAQQRIMVEYSSPNTNKPLHLGHLRNIFLGWSTAQILKACGHHVMKTCVVNDRGIHICKSMIAWQKFGKQDTPQAAGAKGDHFVGDYYVRFSEELKRQVQDLVSTGRPKEEAERQAPIMQEAQQMLVDWEAGKPEVMDLWRTMNSWVYEGFDLTYRRIGADFDKTYYESETYLLGREFVQIGIQKGVFYRKPDGSVWIDLTEEGLDEKLVLRKDGTSVYITQDLGLAHQKYEEFRYDKSIYVIADEQNYHMKVLQLILKKLGMPYADSLYHLSYGMVELPTGRMKSREGTVVDADDLVDEMIREAEAKTREKSNIDDFTQEELRSLYEVIALGALKFYLIKVDPKKKMVFNPQESIDFHGFTGPFIQYTHARIKSILRKAPATPQAATSGSLLPLEKKLLILLEQYPQVVVEAAHDYNPSAIANYVYAVAQHFNTFYTAHSVLKAETEEKKQLRLRLCSLTASTLKKGMQLLGISVPERM